MPYASDAQRKAVWANRTSKSKKTKKANTTPANFGAILGKMAAKSKN